MADVLWSRNLAVYYKDEPCKIQRMERVVAALRNRANLSFSGALKTLLDLGIERYLEDPSCADPELENWNLAVEVLDAAKAELAVKKDFAQVYRELGAKRFLEIVEEKGLDPGTVLESIGSFLPRLSKSENMQEQILELLSDGEEHKVEEIIELAIMGGILPDPKKNALQFKRALGLMRKVASELGVSGGERGYWQLQMPIN